MRAVLVLLVCAASVRADAFDWYTNKALEKITEAGKAVKPLKHLTPGTIVEYDNVLPRVGAACLVVRTNGDRTAKLLVLAAKQKVNAEKAVPILLIERFMTYKEGTERQVFASGANLSLFNDFRLSLDMGQVVPRELAADIRFVVDGDKVYAEPIGKAKLWVLTKHDPTLAPKRAGKVVVGEKIEPKHFAGSYKLFDDGRRTGKLVLAVDGKKITGSYYSGRDGAKYDVVGRIGPAPHAVEFTVRLPRTEQAFRGHMFTGNGKAIAGTSKMAEREAGFYAVREE